MKAYFDLANIESFLLSRDDNPEKFELCNNLLKKQLDVRLNFDFDKFAASELCMTWVTRLMEDGLKTPKCITKEDEIKPARPIKLKQDFIISNDIHDHSSIYFLDEDVEILESRGNYIIVGVGNEVTTLYKMFFDDCSQAIKSLPTRKHFNTNNVWNALVNYAYPCTDIIIADAYILCNKYLFANNLYAFVKTIASKIVYSHLNIIIFSLRETHTKNGVFEPDWQIIRSELKAELQKNDIDANITFVSPETEKDFKEHDRTVFTNYMQYLPGACLNFYNATGDFTSNGRHFHVHSLAGEDNYEEACYFINDMQQLINEINAGSIPGCINKDNGSILSNYLTFQ